jgi:hypothetical protein
VATYALGHFFGCISKYLGSSQVQSLCELSWFHTFELKYVAVDLYDEM